MQIDQGSKAGPGGEGMLTAEPGPPPGEAVGPCVRMFTLAEGLCAQATRSLVSSLWSRVKVSVQGVLGGEHGVERRQEPDPGDLEAWLGRGLILQAA